MKKKANGKLYVFATLQYKNVYKLEKIGSKKECVAARNKFIKQVNNDPCANYDFKDALIISQDYWNMYKWMPQYGHPMKYVHFYYSNFELV